MFSTPHFSSELHILRGQRKKTHVDSGKILNNQRICAFVGEYILSTRVSFEWRSQRTWRAYMAEKAWAGSAMKLLSYFVQFDYGWAGYSAECNFYRQRLHLQHMISSLILLISCVDRQNFLLVLRERKQKWVKHLDTNSIMTMKSKVLMMRNRWAWIKPVSPVFWESLYSHARGSTLIETAHPGQAPQ